ncbi:hypothetical protein Dimus_015255 [Dionaea muscipula]
MEEAREEQQQQELKHLGSVRAAAIQTIVFVSAIYDYAKHNSGSLMPTLERVEGAVAAVVSPVYDKFKDVPDDLLLFLDAKVDSAAAEFDEHAPPLAKQVAGQVQDMIKKASDVAVELLVRAQSDGTQAAALYAATLH